MSLNVVIEQLIQRTPTKILISVGVAGSVAFWYGFDYIPLKEKVNRLPNQDDVKRAATLYPGTLVGFESSTRTDEELIQYYREVFDLRDGKGAQGAALVTTCRLYPSILNQYIGKEDTRLLCRISGVNPLVFPKH